MDNWRWLLSLKGDMAGFVIDDLLDYLFCDKIINIYLFEDKNKFHARFNVTGSILQLLLRKWQ